MLHTQVHRCHSQMQAHLTFIRWTHLIFYHLLWIIRLGVGRSSRCTGPNLVEDVAVDRTTARVWVSILVLATVFWMLPPIPKPFGSGLHGGQKPTSESPVGHLVWSFWT
jgi:hypothetical protein